jgi:hypothetical protein
LRSCFAGTIDLLLDVALRRLLDAFGLLAAPWSCSPRPSRWQRFCAAATISVACCLACLMTSLARSSARRCSFWPALGRCKAVGDLLAPGLQGTRDIGGQTNRIVNHTNTAECEQLPDDGQIDIHPATSG